VLFALFRETIMKKVALGLIIAAFSSGVFAQGETAGGAAAGAGGAAAGSETALTASTMLITAGALAAVVVAGGAKSTPTTNH
jgi:hypothetical protein